MDVDGQWIFGFTRRPETAYQNLHWVSKETKPQRLFFSCPFCGRVRAEALEKENLSAKRGCLVSMLCAFVQIVQAELTCKRISGTQEDFENTFFVVWISGLKI